jgi:1-acyl-sn-glycerol-3-phosphate acyltransferase
MAYGTLLFGPHHRRLLRAARAGSREDLHLAERKWGRATAAALDLTIEMTGLEHVDTGRSYIVLPLHEGFADLLAIQRLPLPMMYAAAEELFEWEHLGPYLHASNQPCISRTNGPGAYRAILRAGKAASGRGESLVVFPQGTVFGIESAFTGGAFRAAHHLGVPVLPIVLTGASSVWDYPFSTDLHFGRTIHMEVLSPVPAHLAVAGMRDIESEMKDRALASTPGPRRYVPERDGWWDDYRFEIDDRFPQVAKAVADHRALRMATR